MVVKFSLDGVRCGYEMEKKIYKKSGNYALILHNYPILVRTTGIEDFFNPY